MPELIDEILCHLDPTALFNLGLTSHNFESTVNNSLSRIGPSLLERYAFDYMNHTGEFHRNECKDYTKTCVELITERHKDKRFPLGLLLRMLYCFVEEYTIVK